MLICYRATLCAELCQYVTSLTSWSGRYVFCYLQFCTQNYKNNLTYTNLFVFRTYFFKSATGCSSFQLVFSRAHARTYALLQLARVSRAYSTCMCLCVVARAECACGELSNLCKKCTSWFICCRFQLFPNVHHYLRPRGEYDDLSRYLYIVV